MSEVPRFQYDWTCDPSYMSPEEAQNRGYRWNPASRRWQRLATAQETPIYAGRPNHAEVAQAAPVQAQSGPHEDVLVFGERKEYYFKGAGAQDLLEQISRGLAGASMQQAVPNPHVDVHRTFEEPARQPIEAASEAPDEDDVYEGELVDEEPQDELARIQADQEQREMSKNARKEERKKTRGSRLAKGLALTTLSTFGIYAGLGIATGSDDKVLSPDNVEHSATFLVEKGQSLIELGKKAKEIGGIFG